VNNNKAQISKSGRKWSIVRITYMWVRHCARITAALSRFLFLFLLSHRTHTHTYTHTVLGLPCFLSPTDSKSCGTRLSLWVRSCEIFALSPGHRLDRALPDALFGFAGGIGSRVNVERSHKSVRPLLIGSWIDLCNFD